MPGIIWCTTSHVGLDVGQLRATSRFTSKFRWKMWSTDWNLESTALLAVGVTVSHCNAWFCNVIWGQNATLKKHRWGYKESNESSWWMTPSNDQICKFWGFGKKKTQPCSRTRNGNSAKSRMGVEAVIRNDLTKQSNIKKAWADLQFASAQKGIYCQTCTKIQWASSKTLADILDEKIIIHVIHRAQMEIYMIDQCALGFQNITKSYFSYQWKAFQSSPEIAKYTMGASVFRRLGGLTNSKCIYSTAFQSATWMQMVQSLLSILILLSWFGHLYHWSAKTPAYGGITDDESLAWSR